MCNWLQVSGREYFQIESLVAVGREVQMGMVYWNNVHGKYPYLG